MINDLHLLYIGGSVVTAAWTTDREADGFLELVTLSDYQSSGFKRTRKASQDGKIINHEVTVMRLPLNTTYYFRVISKDKDGNQAVREGYIFSTLNSEVNEKIDLTINQVAPASSPDPLISSNTVTFLWYTNRPAKGYIEYKPVDNKKAKGGKVQETGYSKYNHQLTIDGLQPDTTYKFKIFAQDILGKKVTLEERLIRTATLGRVLGVYTELPSQSVQSNLRYYTESKRNLVLEQKLAQDLRTYLIKQFNGRVPRISRENWFTLIRAFVYGGYPGEAIVQAIKFGGKTVHPMIFWSAWRDTSTYKEYINR